MRMPMSAADMFSGRAALMIDRMIDALESVQDTHTIEQHVREMSHRIINMLQAYTEEHELPISPCYATLACADALWKMMNALIMTMEAMEE